MGDEKVWLSYPEAAKRVKRSVRNVRRWHSEGMPMTMFDGQMFVEESVLLAWWRDRLNASPVHFYRMRALAREQGLPEPSRAPRERAPRAPKQREPQTEPEHGNTVPQVPMIELPSMRAPDEYADLVDGMRRMRPACDGLEVFTQGPQDEELTRMMADLCGRCPLLLRCRRFAAAERPEFGFWAGRTASEWTRSAHRRRLAANT